MQLQVNPLKTLIKPFNTLKTAIAVTLASTPASGLTPRHRRLAVISLSPSLKATLVEVKNVEGDSKRVKGDYIAKKCKVVHFFN
jgi:hypothetical protein